MPHSQGPNFSGAASDPSDRKPRSKVSWAMSSAASARRTRAWHRARNLPAQRPASPAYASARPASARPTKPASASPLPHRPPRSHLVVELVDEVIIGKIGTIATTLADYAPAAKPPVLPHSPLKPPAAVSDLLRTRRAGSASVACPSSRHGTAGDLLAIAF